MTDPTAAFLREAMEWHFSPATGSPFWLERARTLDFDPRRDVTSLAVFLTNNETSAAIGKDGLAKAGQRGEAFVMARFDAFTVGSQVLVLPKGLQFEYPSEPENNYIDALVAEHQAAQLAAEDAG